MKRGGKALWIVLAAAVVMCAVGGSPARTADHRDAPGIQQDPALDPLDFFMFRNPSNGNTVLAMTMCPFLVAGTLPVPFAPEGLYQFKIENTGDTNEDLVIQVVFDQPPALPFGTLPSPAPAQSFTVLGPGKPKQPGVVNSLLDPRRVRVFSGPANGTTVTGPDGIRAWVGTTDDPFFVDLIWVLGIINGRQITRAPGKDTIAGLNCCTIVVEIPPALLRGSSGNTIGGWAACSRARSTTRSAAPKRENQIPADRPFFSGDRISADFVQVDATALPVVNTTAIGTPFKDAFNRAPQGDERALFRTAAIGRLTTILTSIQALLPAGRTPVDQATAVVDFLLPDISRFDTTSDAGFPNGRRPQDDVITTVLQVLTANSAVTDNVEANDVPFRSDFPFFGVAHSAAAAVPGRN